MSSSTKSHNKKKIQKKCNKLQKHVAKPTPYASYVGSGRRWWWKTGLEKIQNFLLS